MAFYPLVVEPMTIIVTKTGSIMSHAYQCLNHGTVIRWRRLKALPDGAITSLRLLLIAQEVIVSCTKQVLLQIETRIFRQSVGSCQVSLESSMIMNIVTNVIWGRYVLTIFIKVKIKSISQVFPILARFTWNMHLKLEKMSKKMYMQVWKKCVGSPHRQLQ